jgi:hypothetical protein
MRVDGKTRTVCNFKNTCHNCFNDIEYPLLGDFSYGELIFQTKDGQDFGIAVLFDNATFDFVIETLKNDKEMENNKVEPKNILALLADKLHDKEFTPDYPICSICKKRQRHFNDNIRTTKRELHFVTWLDFESLELNDKKKRIKEAALTMT